jgi:tripartite-type tricarboxylate transporter receptor subunit TctC
MRRLWFALLALHAGIAAAQTYPSKPIRIIVPFVAGDAVDALARMLGAKLSETLGQPVIVENRPGAGGNVAADAVAKAPPDGYTILQNTNGQAISPSLSRVALRRGARLHPCDATRRLATRESPKVSATSVPELIALAKAKPGALNYGMTGVGNPLHLTMEMFKTAAGIDIQPVPYKGDAAMFPALITGEVQVAIAPMATTLLHITGGTLRALAVVGASRSAALPDVPAVAESGLVGFESSSWQGWFVPAHTPPDIVDVIQQGAKAALAAPDVLERLRMTGNEAVGSTPAEFEQRFKADLAKFAKIVKEAHIQSQD